MKFPKHPGSKFTSADVEDYLLSLSEKGWKVYERRLGNGYILEPRLGTRIEILHNQGNNEWIIQVSPDLDGKLPFSHDHLIDSFESFQLAIQEASIYLDADLNHPPVSIRLEPDKPATNRTSIVSLTAHSKVLKVFDPYFDDKAIRKLMIFVNLGMKLNKEIKVITGKNGQKSLSEEMVKSFEKEYGVLVSVRRSDNKQHRRFFILNNSESVIFGPSLNSIDYNEVVFRQHYKHDVDLFNKEWEAGVKLF
jgi:hypothetical protein